MQMAESSKQEHLSHEDYSLFPELDWIVVDPSMSSIVHKRFHLLMMGDMLKNQEEKVDKMIDMFHTLSLMTTETFNSIKGIPTTTGKALESVKWVTDYLSGQECEIHKDVVSFIFSKIVCSVGPSWHALFSTAPPEEQLSFLKTHMN